MSHKVPFPPPEHEELSIEEKVDCTGALWDHITADTDKVPVPDWHHEILEERLAKYSDGKGGLKTDGWQTWEEIKEELTKH